MSETKSHVGAKKNFDLSLEGDLLSLTLRGRLGGLNLAALQKWCAEVYRTVQDESRAKGKKLRVIIDVSEIKGYEPDALSSLANLMRDDEPFVLKTATYGGTPLVRLAEDAVFSLAGRANVKSFSTREDALAWLYS